MGRDVIVHLGKARHDGQGHVVIDRVHEHPDGTLENGVFIFPDDTLEWRAAEYDLDPGDLDLLMEIVIAECYVTPDSDHDMPALFTMATVADARAHHLAKCEEIRQKHFPKSKRIRSGARHVPEGDWQQHFVMHEEALSLKKKIVTRARLQVNIARPEKLDPHTERIKHLSNLIERGDSA